MFSRQNLILGSLTSWRPYINKQGYDYFQLKRIFAPELILGSLTSWRGWILAGALGAPKRPPTHDLPFRGHLRKRKRQILVSKLAAMFFQKVGVASRPLTRPQDSEGVPCPT